MKGDVLPSASLKVWIKTSDRGTFEWKDVSSDQLFKESRAVVVAFADHLEDFVEAYDSYLSLGIDDVYCVSVDATCFSNYQGNLQQGLANDNAKSGNGICKVKLVHDVDAQFIRLMGVEEGENASDHPYSMVVDNRVIEEVFIDGGVNGLSLNSAVASFKESNAMIMLKYLRSRPLCPGQLLKALLSCPEVDETYPNKDYLIGVCPMCIREERAPVYRAQFLKSEGPPKITFSNGLETIDFFSASTLTLKSDKLQRTMRGARNHYKKVHFTNNNISVHERMLPAAMRLTRIGTQKARVSCKMAERVVSAPFPTCKVDGPKRAHSIGTDQSSTNCKRQCMPSVVTGPTVFCRPSMESETSSKKHQVDPLEPGTPQEEALQALVTQMTADVEGYEQTMATLTRRAVDLKEEKQKGLDKLSRTQSMLDDAVAANSKLESESGKSRRLLQIREQELQDQEEEIEDLKKVIRDQKHEIKEEKQAKQALQQANASLESKLGEISDKLTKAKAHNAHLQSSLALAKTQQIALEEERRAREREERICKRAAFDKVMSSLKVLACEVTETEEDGLDKNQP